MLDNTAKTKIIDTYNQAVRDERKYAEERPYRCGHATGTEYGIEKTLKALGYRFEFADGFAIDIEEL